MPIPTVFLQASKKVSEGEMSRDIESEQKEVKLNYQEYENPNKDLNNISLED